MQKEGGESLAGINEKVKRQPERLDESELCRSRGELICRACCSLSAMFGVVAVVVKLKESCSTR